LATLRIRLQVPVLRYYVAKSLGLQEKIPVNELTQSSPIKLRYTLPGELNKMLLCTVPEKSRT